MMEEGDERKVVAGYDGDVSVQKSRNWIFIWAGVIVIVLVLLAVVVYFVFMSDSGDRNSEESLDGYLGEMEGCLEMDEFDLDCNLLFSSPGLYVKCENLGELRDECFYEIVVRNFRGEYCENIINENLKENCEQNSFVGGGEFHE